MSTLQVGASCSLASCNEVDFLPILCPLCTSKFCRNHASPEAHVCVNLKPDHDASTGKSMPSRELCALQGCSKLALESLVQDARDAGRTPAICPRCKSSFCVVHRHPDTHACSSANEEQKPRNPEARALLEKHFGHSLAKPSSSPTQRPKPFKLTQVTLMKLRQKSTPADAKDAKASFNPQDCFALRVRDSRGGGAQADMSYWFRKTILTGKALDLLATKMRFSRSQDERIVLNKIVDDELIPLQNGQPLLGQVAEADEVELTEEVREMQ